MWWRCSVLMGLLAAACAAGCTAGGPPSLPALPSGPDAIQTAAVPSVAAVETTMIAAGTPTEVYAQVARAALRCWFGADGPLKRTHIFNAEAASPTQGGAAGIVLLERDGSHSDQRGARAFHMSFVGDAAGVRVGISNLKMPDAIGQLMVKDAATWARGGEGCETRTLAPAISPTRSPLTSQGQRNTPR